MTVLSREERDGIKRETKLTEEKPTVSIYPGGSNEISRGTASFSSLRPMVSFQPMGFQRSMERESVPQAA